MLLMMMLILADYVGVRVLVTSISVFSCLIASFSAVISSSCSSTASHFSLFSSFSAST